MFGIELNYILAWLLFGLLVAIPTYGRKSGMIRVSDIPLLLVLGGIGPIWLLIILLELLKKLYDTHKDTVLWRSQTEKTKHILYGDKDSQNSYPKNPWGES